MLTPHVITQSTLLPRKPTTLIYGEVGTPSRAKDKFYWANKYLAAVNHSILPTGAV